MKTFKLNRLAAAAASALGLAGAAHGQVVVNDTLTGTNSAYDWYLPGYNAQGVSQTNGACLTAGTSFTIVPGQNSIPACRVGTANMSYYGGKTLVGGATGKLPDASGAGALRLTNGDLSTGGADGTNQTGAIVSNFTFPTNEGIQVTWTSVTYGGNAYKNNITAAGIDNKSGADGITFFLSDGGADKIVDKVNVGTNPPTVGAQGGSLGYSCSNSNSTYDGVVGGYLGVGIDEFGNFSNPGDSTSSGPGQTPGAIVVRGAGHTAWPWLTANYSSYYPSNLAAGEQANAVRNTCKTGYLFNYSTTTYSVVTSTPTKGNPNATTVVSVGYGKQFPTNAVGASYKLDYNYPYLKGSNFPSGSYIFNQEALGKNSDGSSKAIRTAATPITYSLLITQAGKLTFTYSINKGTPVTVMNDFDITASNGPLPASFRFGFSAGTGGGSNIHEITCFKAAPANFSNSTASSNVQSGRVQTDSQVYLAYYHPINSWGSLTAQSLVFTDATSSNTGKATLVVSPSVNWDAGCVLTGGTCLSQGNASVTALTTNATRTILSWDGSKGIPFEWANLTSGSKGQQAALTAGDTVSNADRLDYLRGSRAKEVGNAGGVFRARTSLLGDIVDSSPVWVGPPSSPFSDAWTDLLNPKTSMPEGTSYGAWATNAARSGRTNVVYAGANDGMLHGFSAGSYASGTFSTAGNTGKELLAYVPNQVVSTIHSTTDALDFSDPSYSHNFYVDASPTTGDLYYNGTWHTWVVGGLGAGAQAAGPIADLTTPATGSVYALDVTDPAAFDPHHVGGLDAETAASKLVMGDWTSAWITAKGCGSVPKCGDNLGATYGTPAIRRLHDGTWAVIFGNGLNSVSGTAGLFIVHIDQNDGSAKSVQFLDTGTAGPTNTVNGATVKTLNGIAQVTPVDLDGDHVADYVYAGDVLGNVWRFDLTSANSGNWKVRSAPIFKTQAGQPITSGIAVDAVTTADDNGSTSANPRIVLAFGTGQKFPKTLTSDSSYPTTQQSIYGIWDSDMDGWNGLSATDYMSLGSSQVTPKAGSTGGNLVQQVLSKDASGARILGAAKPVCYQGGSCKTASMGWEMDLSVTPATSTSPAIAEQVLFNPLIIADVLNTNTSIPTIAQALTCDTSSEQAYSFGIDIASGGPVVTSGGAIPPSNTGSYFAGYTSNTVGVATQATGTSSYVTTKDGSQWLVFQKNDGTGGTQQIYPPGTPTGTTPGERLTWIKMR